MRSTHLHRVPALGYIFLRIGAAAFAGGVELHELAATASDLERTFLELTADPQ